MSKHLNNCLVATHQADVDTSININDFLSRSQNFDILSDEEEDSFLDDVEEGMLEDSNEENGWL